MKVLIIDANALVYRIYHAMPLLNDFQGRPIQVIYGLVNMLLKLLSKEKADYVFAAYDRPEPTLRHKTFKDYKAQRPKIADDLKIQLSLSKRVFNAFDIPVIEKVGYEADDIIASLKSKFLPLANEIIIFTGDLDTLQLIDEKTKVLTMKKGISETIVYDIHKVKERFGILPQQISDYKALIGDASDNIPGIAGIGPKTAVKLLADYQNLEGIIEAASIKSLDKNLAKKILENKNKILFYRDLVILKNDINLNESLLVPYSGFSKDKLAEFFQEFGFRSLLNRLKIQEEKTADVLKAMDQGIEKTNGSFFKFNQPFFLFLEKDKIKIITENNHFFTLTIDKLRQVLLLPQQKFVFDLKNIFKIIFKEDFCFDKKINLFQIYDLKIIFWLLNPQRTNFSFEDVVLYFGIREQNIFILSQKMLTKLKEESLEEVYLNFELPLIPILARTELRGIKINLDTLNSFKNDLKQNLTNILEEIYQLSGEKFNPSSPLQLRKVLFEKLKLKQKNLAKTDKGFVSTQESELLKLINQHPIIEKILQYRKINKFLTTYTDSLLKSYSGKEKRIHTVFNQTGTSTGRIASESPNLQNLPISGSLAKLLREAFVSDEGFVFVAGDYSQIELRILAHLSGDDNLIAVFQNDLDIHSQTAKMIFGDDTEENRRKAKIINFSIVYGTTAKALANRLLIPVSEANKLIERFYYFYPGVKKLKENFIEFAKIYGYVETLFGRKRFVFEINSQSYREKKFAERVAFNMPIQGLGADLIKKAMISIDQEIFQRGWQNDAYFILSVHDEIIFEVKEDIKNDFRSIIKEKMENVFKLNVPLKVRVKEGKTLKELN